MLGGFVVTFATSLAAQERPPEPETQAASGDSGASGAALAGSGAAAQNTDAALFQREEQQRIACLNSLSAENKALVNQVQQQWNQQIAAMGGAQGSSDMARMRDAAVDSIVSPYCRSPRQRQRGRVPGDGPPQMFPLDAEPDETETERQGTCPGGPDRDREQMIAMARQQYDFNINAIRNAGGAQAAYNITVLERERDQVIADLSKRVCVLESAR